MNRLLYVKSKAKLKQKTLTLTLTLRDAGQGMPNAEYFLCLDLH